MSEKRKGKGAPKKNDRRFISLIVILLVAGLGTVAYFVTRPKPVITIDPNTPLPEAKGYVRGKDTAPVEIVEFGDLECPVCGQFATITEPDVISRIVEPGLARYRFVDFPNPEAHPNTMFAHNAAACADAQGKFWDMHDKLYLNQYDWSAFAHGKHSGNPTKTMEGYARDLALDTKAFNACFESRQFEPQIRANAASGVKRNVGSTPNFFIGNKFFPYKMTYDEIKAAVDSAAAEIKRGDTTKKSQPKK